MESNDAVKFRVWGGDNIAYGPMELPELVGWIDLHHSDRAADDSDRSSQITTRPPFVRNV